VVRGILLKKFIYNVLMDHLVILARLIHLRPTLFFEKNLGPTRVTPIHIYLGPNKFT